MILFIWFLLASTSWDQDTHHCLGPLASFYADGIAGCADENHVSPDWIIGYDPNNE